MMEKKKKENIAQNCFFKQKKVYYYKFTTYLCHMVLSHNNIYPSVCFVIFGSVKKNKIMHVSTGGEYDFKNP